MMETLQNENSLLKAYISTLQKENEARDQQTKALFNQIDRITTENDRLHQSLKKSTITSNSPQKSAISPLEREELVIMKKTKELLTKELSSLKKQMADMNEEINNLRRMNKSSELLTTEANEAQNAKITFSRITGNFGDKQSQIIRISQSPRNLNQELRNSNQLQSSSKLFQLQNKEAGSRHQSIVELSNLINKNLSLQANVRHLNSKIQWSQLTKRTLQSEKAVLQSKLRQVQKSLSLTLEKTNHYIYFEEQLKKKQAAILIKEKEMQALQKLILHLKQSKNYLQKTLKEKQQHILDLQSQTYSYRSSNYQYQMQKHEISELIMVKAEYERQIANLVRSNQEFYEENIRIKQELINANSALLQLKQQRQTFIRKPITQFESQQDNISFSPREYRLSTNQNQNLRDIVEKLQLEVHQIKRNAPKIQDYNSKDSTQRQRNLMTSRKKSTSKRKYSKYLPEKEKQVLCRSQWQLLQRKINVLKNENDVLRKQLFQ